MDAYDLYQKLFACWQSVSKSSSATELKKQWNYVPVYVDGKRVVDIVVEDNKINLVTK
jgi:hypothetical protein